MGPLKRRPYTENEAAKLVALHKWARYIVPIQTKSDAWSCKRGRRELRWAAERFFDECDDRDDEWRFPFEGSV